METGGRAVRVLGQEQGGLVVAVFDVGLVDAGVGAHDAEGVPDDQDPGFLADDLRGFVQDELHEAGVLVGLLAQDHGFRGRRHVGETDHAPFGLRDDLLRDDQHVAVFEHEVLRGDGVEQQAREVVPGHHHGEPFDADDGERWRGDVSGPTGRRS